MSHAPNDIVVVEQVCALGRLSAVEQTGLRQGCTNATQGAMLTRIDLAEGLRQAEVVTTTSQLHSLTVEVLC